MKKSLINYAVIPAVISVISVLLLLFAGGISAGILDRLNDKYMPLYMAGERGVSSPWYKDGFHIVDEAFIDELKEIKAYDKNVISIGSSLSVISFRQDTADADSDYSYRFLTCGNGCYKSDKQMYNLYKAYGAEHPDDIIKLEVSWSTFRDMERTITQAAVKKWRRFDILEDDSVVAMGWPFTAVSHVNEALIKIQNVLELVQDYLDKSRTAEENGQPVIPGNFVNNYFNYDTVAGNCNMTTEMQNELTALIDTISNEHILTVEISPIPEGLAKTGYGRKFCGYIDEILIPGLEEKGISYYDYRYDFRDEDFIDGVHLGYEPGAKYTKMVMDDLKEFSSK